MANVTFGGLVDAAFLALGKADAGEDRAPVLQDLLELYAFDLSSKAGAQYARGSALLTVGTAGVYSGAALQGEYDLPGLLAACAGIARLVPDPALSQPATVWEHPLYTAAYDFYRDTPHTVQGKPNAALLLGRKITFDPIPSPTTWYGQVLFEGSVYVDTTSFVEGTVVPHQVLVPALRAGASYLAAQRMKRFDVAATWAAIYEQRAMRPAAASLTSARRTAVSTPDF